MAQFQSYGVTPNSNHFGTREFYEAGTRIELLMNPGDPDFAKLQDAMYAFLPASGVTDKFAANSKYVAVCQKILKREWEALKREISHAGGIANNRH